MHFPGVKPSLLVPLVCLISVPGPLLGRMVAAATGVSSYKCADDEAEISLLTSGAVTTCQQLEAFYRLIDPVADPCLEGGAFGSFVLTAQDVYDLCAAHCGCVPPGGDSGDSGDADDDGTDIYGPCSDRSDCIGNSEFCATRCFNEACSTADWEGTGSDGFCQPCDECWEDADAYGDSGTGACPCGPGRDGARPRADAPMSHARLRFAHSRCIDESPDGLCSQVAVVYGPYSDWDVSKVTNFRSLFHTQTLFDQNIGTWDTSRVTDLTSAFWRADAFDGNLSQWDTSKVELLTSTFFNIGEMGGRYQISAWDVSRVQSLAAAFTYSNTFNSDISNWDTSKVTDFGAAFASCSGFNVDIGNWDTARVTTIESMMTSISSFNYDLSGWDTAKVVSMGRVFHWNSAFNGNISGWDTARVTNTEEMFSAANEFNQDISAWDTAKFTTLRHMFDSVNSFNADLSNWDIAKVENMYKVFYEASNYNNDLSRWDTARVKTFEHTFRNSGFNGDLSGWDTASATTLDSMFMHTPLTDGGLSAWDTSKVTDMSNTFYGASSFNGNLSTWDTSSVIDMASMFEGASSFNKVDGVSSFDVSSVDIFDNMFSGSSNLFDGPSATSQWVFKEEIQSPTVHLTATTDGALVVPRMDIGFGLVEFPNLPATAHGSVVLDGLSGVTHAVLPSRSFEGASSTCDDQSVGVIWQCGTQSFGINSLCSISCQENDCQPIGEDELQGLGYLVSNARPLGLFRQVYQQQYENYSTVTIMPAATKPSSLGTISCLAGYGALSSSEGTVGVACWGDGQSFEMYGCEPCANGTIGASSNVQPCSECEPGTVGEFAVGETCTACGAGTYQDEYGQTACKPAPVGHQVLITGARQFTQCPMGEFSDETGRQFCTRCADDWNFGATYTTIDEGSVTCDACVEGYYMSLDGSCIACASTAGVAFCERGSTIKQLFLKAGYTRLYADAPTVEGCPVGGGDACVGRNITGTSACKAGYKGPLCAVCDHGGFRTIDDGAPTCKGCTESTVSLATVFAVLAVVTMTVKLESKYHVSSILASKFSFAIDDDDEDGGEHDIGSDDGAANGPVDGGIEEAAIAKTSFGVRRSHLSSFFGSGALGKSRLEHRHSVVRRFASVFNVVVGDEEDSLKHRKKSAVETRASVIWGAFKVGYPFVQTLVMMPRILDQEFPPSYQAILDACSFLGLNLAEIFPFVCVFDEPTYLATLLSASAVPLASLAAIAMFTLFSLHEASVHQHKSILAKGFEQVLFVLYVFFPAVSMSVFATFRPCHELDDGKSYMREDYSTVCFTSGWVDIVVVSCVLFLIFTVGVPMLFAWLLRGNVVKVKAYQRLHEIAVNTTADFAVIDSLRESPDYNDPKSEAKILLGMHRMASLRLTVFDDIISDAKSAGLDKNDKGSISRGGSIAVRLIKRISNIKSAKPMQSDAVWTDTIYEEDPLEDDTLETQASEIASSPASPNGLNGAGKPDRSDADGIGKSRKTKRAWAGRLLRHSLIPRSRFSSSTPASSSGVALRQRGSTRARSVEVKTGEAFVEMLIRDIDAMHALKVKASHRFRELGLRDPNEDDIVTLVDDVMTPWLKIELRLSRQLRDVVANDESGDLGAQKLPLRSFKSLFVAYRVWWWDVFDALRRLVLDAGILFMQGTAIQLVVAVLVQIVALFLALKHKPYILQWCDDFNAAGHGALLAIYLFVLLNRVDRSDDNMAEDAYGVIMAIVSLAVPIMLILWGFRAVYLRRVRKSSKKLRSMNETSPLDELLSKLAGAKPFTVSEFESVWSYPHKRGEVFEALMKLVLGRLSTDAAFLAKYVFPLDIWQEEVVFTALRGAARGMTEGIMSQVLQETQGMLAGERGDELTKIESIEMIDTKRIETMISQQVTVDFATLLCHGNVVSGAFDRGVLPHALEMLARSSYVEFESNLEMIASRVEEKLGTNERVLLVCEPKKSIKSAKRLAVAISNATSETIILDNHQRASALIGAIGDSLRAAILVESAAAACEAVASVCDTFQAVRLLNRFQQERPAASENASWNSKVDFPHIDIHATFKAEGCSPTLISIRIQAKETQALMVENDNLGKLVRAKSIDDLLYEDWS